MVAKPWGSVSPDTIQNCWRKSGFLGVVVDPMQDPFKLSNERSGGLWTRRVHQYPSPADISFYEFTSLDKDVITEHEMAENDAERAALEAGRPEPQAGPQEDADASDFDSLSVTE